MLSRVSLATSKEGGVACGIRRATLPFARMNRSDIFLQRLHDAAHGAAKLPLVMGVCNVTPDSFSDGGEHFALRDAMARVDQLLEEGADIIDVGGESTRPGAELVPGAEQLSRTLEVVRYAAARALVSIDTADPEVAEACLQAGACIVNDVSCLRDARLARVAASHRAAFVLMHSRGLQRDMGGNAPVQPYADVVGEVAAEWEAAAARAAAEGLARERLVFDPGFGFAKAAEHSMGLLIGLRDLCRRLGVPMLIGASRKSFLRLVDPVAGPRERLGASIAAAVVAWQRGAACVRVHDVRATRQALGLFVLAGRPEWQSGVFSREAGVPSQEVKDA